MKPSALPRGVLIAVLFLFVRASSAISARKLLHSAGAHIADELEGLRTRLVESTGFSQPQWARKLKQAYYPTASYGDYGYGYYGYYGAYSGGGGHDYMMMGRRLMSDGSASREGNHARALQQAYPYPYGYGGYYGYYYGAYPANPYSSYQMMNGRRRVLGNVEQLAELLVDETDGFVKPGDRTLLAEDGVEDPRRALKQMPYDAYPTSSYGSYGSYGYGYYYGGSYVNPYQW